MQTRRENPRNLSHPRRGGELNVLASALVSAAAGCQSSVIWLSFLLDPPRPVWIVSRMDSLLEALLETPRGPLSTHVASKKQ